MGIDMLVICILLTASLTLGFKTPPKSPVNTGQLIIDSELNMKNKAANFSVDLIRRVNIL